MAKKGFVVHPFLFGVFPGLFLLSHNKEEIWIKNSYIEILTLLAASMILTVFCFFFFKLFLKDNKKTGAMASLSLFLFFSYGHFYNIAVNLMPKQIGVTTDAFIRYIIYLLIWLSIFIGGYIATSRTKKSLDDLTKFLNVLAGALVAISLINVLIYVPSKSITLDNPSNKEEAVVPTHVGDKQLPDIYYLIPDRYGNSQSLKDFYNFDNSDFIQRLRERGFYVAEESRSNYIKTAPSMASSLNLDYINYLTEEVGKDNTDWSHFYDLIRDNKVLFFLKEKGYKYFHFGGWWSATKESPYAEMNFNKDLVPEFTVLFLRTTMVRPFEKIFSYLSMRMSQYNRIIYQFTKLAEMPDIEGPKFVFVHMSIPHPPYAFDKDGTFVPKDVLDSRSRAENYINQLQYLNTELLKFIDNLISNSAMPPIILLQADEGPAPIRYEEDENAFFWKEATQDELREKISILNAYYLPNKDNSLLYPFISPVNSFRVIFNLYFDTEYDLLPDRSYAHKFQKNPYDFFQIYP